MRHAGALLLLCLLSVACESPLRSLVESRVSRDQASSLDCSTAGNSIDRHSRLTFSFEKPMTASSLKASGSLAAAASSIDWTNTQTVTVYPPVEGWSVGTLLSLSLSATDTQGWKSQSFDRTFGVLAGVVYADAENGNDLYPGTLARPVASVARVMEIRSKVYGGTAAEVRLAGGSYNPASLGMPTLWLVDPTTVRGGFAPGFGVQDPVAYPTSLGPVATVDRSTVVVKSTGVCVLENLTIEESGLTTYSNLLVEQGEAVVRGCRLEIGQGPATAVKLLNTATLSLVDSEIVVLGYGLMRGVFADGEATVSSENSTIRVRALGSSDIAWGVVAWRGNLSGCTVETWGDQSTGVSFGGGGTEAGTVSVTGCDIRAAGPYDATNAKAMVLLSLSHRTTVDSNTLLVTALSKGSTGVIASACPQLTLVNNIVFGGCGDKSYGVVLTGGTVGTLTNNTIHGGTASMGTAYYLALAVYLEASTAALRNNLLVTEQDADHFQGYGLFLSGGSSLTALSDNAFVGMDGADSGLCRVSLGTSSLDYRANAGGMSDLESAYTGSGNLMAAAANLTLVTAARPLSLTADSPNEVVHNSTAGSAPTVDRWGTPRTVPYSLGAVEYD